MSTHVAAADIDLDALFDQVAAAREQAQPIVVAPRAPGRRRGAAKRDLPTGSAPPELSVAAGPEAGDDGPRPGPEEPGAHVFQRLGQLTRTLHEALRELGYDQKLATAAGTMPDARMRLEYIASLTGRSAETVLEGVEQAQALQKSIGQGASDLEQRWNALFAGGLSVEDFKQLASATRDHLRQARADTDATQEHLHQMMMAQDFHDLTGQVIKKIVGVAHTVEASLVGLLIEARAADPLVPGALSGPVVGTDATADTVSSQEQVDHLLDSLGF